MPQSQVEHAKESSAISRLVITLVIVAAIGFLIEILLMKGLAYVGSGLHEGTADVIDAILVALLVGPIAVAVVMIRHPRQDADPARLLSGRSGKAMAVGVFVIGVIAAASAATIAWRQIQASDEVRFHRLSDRLTTEVTRRFQIFEYGLQGARGLWRASKSVERGEFVEWVRSRDLKKEFYGATGMGFIHKVAPSQMDAFLRQTRQDGEPTFAVHPEQGVPGRDRYVIEFIEPITTNQQAMGFDIAIDDVRWRAANEAAMSGNPTMTAPVTLVQAPDEGASFLYLHAVYQNNTPLGTAEQRVAATLGWVYFPIVYSRVLRGAIETVDGELDFELLDGVSREKGALVYDEDGHLGLPGGGVVTKQDYRGRLFTRFDTVMAGQRQLILATSTSAKFAPASRGIVWGVLCGGILLSALAGGLIYAVSGTADRARELSMSKTREIERTTAALARSEAALRTTSRLARVGWWELDNVTKQLHWSDETRAIHRVGTDFQPTLESAIEFYAPEARHRIGNAVNDAILHRKPYDLELPLIAADGAKLWVRAQGEPVLRDGQVVSIFGAFQDVTEQVHSRQRAEDASRSKSEFLANMSHEIRTPMTAILGFTDLLAEDGDIARAPERRQDAIHTIRRNGQHLLALINDILDVSKIEAGKMTVEHIPTEIHRIIEDVMSLMRVRTQAKGITLSAVYGTEIPRVFMCDPVRVKQILVNLVGNAIKFTEKGGVTIRTTFDPVGPHGGTLTIAVQDTGVGMTDAQLARIFRPFSQADETMTRTFGGTGLGLTIARRLAELLGGEISVKSEYGKGSTFSVTLATGHVPVGDTWNPTGASISAVPELLRGAELPSLDGVRVLLAEDGVDNQRLISFFLTRAGVRLTIVENGKKVIEAMSAPGEDGTTLLDPPPFDLILMDMQMPELDGYSATRRLRTLGCRVPIVALTAHAMAGDRQVCLDAGCDDYTTKPIDRALLISVCARWASRAMLAHGRHGTSAGDRR
jgi:signal transduction histidine kinase/FixJ family two-component response regulator